MSQPFAGKDRNLGACQLRGEEYSSISISSLYSTVGKENKEKILDGKMVEKMRKTRYADRSIPKISLHDFEKRIGDITEE